ncbi:unnamed protein product [Ectocarpus sp. CCAP 1310/34]|nr:unnamed protein product [Ectocarpus sp. CCAP 1310/34]
MTELTSTSLLPVRRGTCLTSTGVNTTCFCRDNAAANERVKSGTEGVYDEAPADTGGELDSALTATARRLTILSISCTTWSGSCSRRPSVTRSRCLSTTDWILESVEVRSVDEEEADGAPTEGAAVDATDGGGDVVMTRSWTLGGGGDGGSKPLASTWPPLVGGVSRASATGGTKSSPG